MSQADGSGRASAVSASSVKVGRSKPCRVCWWERRVVVVVVVVVSVDLRVIVSPSRRTSVRLRSGAAAKMSELHHAAQLHAPV
jgi:disulfide bond formation protein DsbB